MSLSISRTMFPDGHDCGCDESVLRINVDVSPVRPGPFDDPNQLIFQCTGCNKRISGSMDPSRMTANAVSILEEAVKSGKAPEAVFPMIRETVMNNLRSAPDNGLDIKVLDHNEPIPGMAAGMMASHIINELCEKLDNETLTEMSGFTVGTLAIIADEALTDFSATMMIKDLENIQVGIDVVARSGAGVFVEMIKGWFDKPPHAQIGNHLGVAALHTPKMGWVVVADGFLDTEHLPIEHIVGNSINQLMGGGDYVDLSILAQFGYVCKTCFELVAERSLDQHKDHGAGFRQGVEVCFARNHGAGTTEMSSMTLLFNEDDLAPSFEVVDEYESNGVVKIYSANLTPPNKHNKHYDCHNDHPEGMS